MLLASGSEGAWRAAKQVREVLETKRSVAYEDRAFSQQEAERVVRSALRVRAWAVQELPRRHS